tara:strand:+ start:106266 stop:106685 length:420 start_codon:yes stop_codon:yes gene_type:complete
VTTPPGSSKTGGSNHAGPGRPSPPSILRQTVTKKVTGYRIDPAARIATRDGEELALTAREFDLLEYLARRPGQVFDRRRLLQAVWGWSFGDLSTVTVHVRRLREKIEPDRSRPRHLVTVWGVGYRFDPTGEPPGEGGAS